MLQNRAPLPVVSLADLSGDIPGRSDAVSQGIQDMKELDAHNVEENGGFASAQRGENGRLEIFENRTRTHRTVRLILRLILNLRWMSCCIIGLLCMIEWELKVNDREDDQELRTISFFFV